MLGTSPLVAFIPVTDLGSARNFYASVLGLRVTGETPVALVADANGTQLRLTLVSDHRPQPFTIAGWEVTDIRASVLELTGRGVTFLRFDQMDQDAAGVWAAPGGDLVAWFTDPDGNTLSLTQFSR